MQGDRGFVDAVLCKPPRLLLVEFKGYRADGSLTPLEAEQYEWLASLQGCEGVEAYLWSPEDWQSGEILRVLKGETP